MTASTRLPDLEPPAGMPSAYQDPNDPPGYAQHKPEGARYSLMPLLVPLAVKEALLRAEQQGRSEFEAKQKAEAAQHDSASKAKHPTTVAEVVGFADERAALISAFEQRITNGDRARFHRVLTADELLRVVELVLNWCDDAAGAGKTRYATDLAEALGVPMRRHSMEEAQSSAVLLGTERHWSKAGFGLIFELVLLGDHENPIVLIDELEGRRGRQLPSDRCVAFVAGAHDLGRRGRCLARHDLQRAAGYPRGRPRTTATRSRFDPFAIPRVRDPLADRLASASARARRRAKQVADPKVIDFAPPEDTWCHKLAFCTPRLIGQHVRVATARAVANNRRHLTTADLPADAADPVRKDRTLH